MTERNASPGILPHIVDRWSPRSFDETAVPQTDLDLMFEAAGWAPSAYNYQPWKFLYAVRDDANWDRFMEPLIPFNQSWVKSAGALLYVVSDENMRQGEKSDPNHTHSFDAGAAWAMLALQATHMGYHTHGMSGVDFDKAREVLGVPVGYHINAAIAIGRKDSPEKLPEGLREGEVPSERKPVSEIAIAGNFR